MKEIVESHGGTVEKFIGDAVMAVFGVPVAHEDDALRAVRAAAEMREVLPELGVQARIGVNTGEVVTGTEERLATGDAVNVAARLEQAAAPGEVLLGAETLGLVEDAVEAEPVEPLELKGKREPVRAFRLVRVGEAPERSHGGLFVGRQRELDQILDAWTRASAEQRCELVTIVAEAGIGKTRLVAEALSRPRRAGRPRALPLLRRGDHLLARGRGREAARCPAVRLGSGGGDRVAPRRDGRRNQRRTDRMGLPEAAGGAVASRLRRRGPALGRGDLPRPGRARRAALLRRCDPDPRHGQARAARPAAGMAGGAPADAARTDGRRSARSGVATGRVSRQDRPRRRRQSALRRRDGGDGGRWWR